MWGGALIGLGSPGGGWGGRNTRDWKGQKNNYAGHPPPSPALHALLLVHHFPQDTATQ